MAQTKNSSKSKPKVTLLWPKELVKPAIPPPGVKLDETVYVTMRDGVQLAEKDGRYPGLLSIAPYLKEIQQQPPELSHSIEAGDTAFFVPKGYVHVIAQIRGTGLSQGQFTYYGIKEQEDGYDLIEWIAQQPWCDGKVALIGDSFYARMQYLIAAQQPPHLKCIAPWDAATDLYRDTIYKGGIYWGDFMSMYIPDTTAQCIWPGPVEGKLPPANMAADIVSNPCDGPYFWERSGYTKSDKIKVPILSMATQYNMNHLRGQLDIFTRIKSTKKLVVAPRTGFFSHVYFRYSKALKEQLLRWYDYWLKGIDTGIMNEPQVAICDLATQEWFYENEYPLARTKWTKYYLRTNPSGTAMDPPFGLISAESPANEKPDTYRMPESSRLLNEGKPVLAYTSDPMAKELRVWGPLSAVIYGSSSSLDTAWFVKVGDVGPDGKVNILTEGTLKASFRAVDPAKSKPAQPWHPFDKQEILEPGKVYEFQIEMIPIFWTFKKGHKIWVQIASDDLHFHTPLHTLDVQLMPTPAENTIYHDIAHQSHVLLPVIPDAPHDKPVGPPVAEMKWPFTPGTVWDPK
jgi:predicted acyl esterase